MDIDPQTVCGYNPCMVAKCILLPYATCVSDFKCRPVFFDSEERKVSQCTGNFCFACCFLVFFQAKRNVAQRGFRTHDPEIRSLMLYRLSVSAVIYQLKYKLSPEMYIGPFLSS